MSNVLARLALGPRHREVLAKRRARRQKPDGPWPGQVTPRPAGYKLRPPPPPGGPAAAEEATAAAQAIRSADSTQSPEDATASSGLWAPVAEPPREGWWPRARRFAVLGVVGVVGVTGVTSIAGQVVEWTRPAPTAPPPPAVSEVEYAGVARQAAVEWLSWDASAPQSRQSALDAVTAAGVSDSWSGTGRQWADSASVLSVRRGDDARALATVRTRVMPAKSSAGSGTTQRQATSVPPHAAAAPAMPQDVQPARWMTVDVPLALRDGRVVVTAPPAPVGGTSGSVTSPALQATATTQNAQDFAESTEPVVRRLLTSYAAGDLEYARAAGSQVSGLDGAVRLSELESWRAHPAGQDPSRRSGDATVTWSLSGGAELTSTYRIDLEQEQGRWYLAGVSVPSETPSEEAT